MKTLEKKFRFRAFALGWFTALSALIANALSSYAATVTWNGAGTTNNWSTGLNWVGSSAPSNDGAASLIFAGFSRLTPNIDTGWNVNSLAFASGAGAFTVGGSALTIQGGGIANNSSNTQTITASIALGASQTWSAASANLTISNSLVNLGTRTLTVDGA